MLLAPVPSSILKNFTSFLGSFLLIISIFNILCLLIWSFAQRWSFPNLFPSIWTFNNWTRHWSSLQETIKTTLEVGIISSAIALFLVVGFLENEQQIKSKVKFNSFWLIYLPLLVPQPTFLLGIQILSISLNFDGTLLFLVWSHLLFVLPYIFLSLSKPWQSLDKRFLTTAQCLGSSPFRNLFRIKLPILLRPLLVALAIGFSVSFAQYLPTIFAGRGRFATLTTEAVSYASSADWRIIGVYAFLQSFLPFTVILLALFIPKWLYRHRSAMS